MFIVTLRTPESMNDRRSDPFWEFGSFGCTGCHKKDLMRIINAKQLLNSKLAFAQAGNEGRKLVYITPIITNVYELYDPIKKEEFCEVKWKPISMPIKYKYAPLLINKKGDTNFNLIKEYIRDINSNKWLRRFYYKIRNDVRAKPALSLHKEIAGELEELYTNIREDDCQEVIANNYIEALPRPINKDFLNTRIDTYKKTINKLKVKKSYQHNECKNK